MKEDQQKNPETVKAETAQAQKKPRNRPRRQELERLT